jgi:hypothetical protein
MMAIPSRHTVRDDLVSKITSDITTLQAVYGYLPKDFGGQSPVCTVENGPLQIDVTTDIYHQEFTLIVGFWIRRDGGAGSGLDAATSEDMLDSLAQALATLLAKSYNARFSMPSDLFYDMIDGNDYRIEFHYVELEW